MSIWEKVILGIMLYIHTYLCRFGVQDCHVSALAVYALV